MILMQKRNLFANQIGEKVEQNNKPQEEEEEIFIEKSEDPRGIKGLDLSKHRKRWKKCRRRCWNCTIKIDAHLSDAFGVISWDTPKQIAIRA